jgi:Family of unknown function (DUF5330)
MRKNELMPRTSLSMLSASLRPAAVMRTAWDAGLMFFLLRMTFWLGIVLILLPGVPQHDGSASGVGTADAISAASATVHDLKGFCGREPDACTVGSEVATSMGHRAQAGAKMLYDFLTAALAERDAAPHSSEPAKSALSKPSSQQRASQNTLTPADLAPTWRGPARKAGTHPA